MKILDKRSPVPYYYQIVEALRATIEGQPVDGEEEIALPSEAELCQTYSVTRGTVRHALDVLEREGLIYREKGRGSFVRRRRLEVEVARLVSTTEDMIARGWTPGGRVLSLRRVQAGERMAQHLQLRPEQEVFELWRVRLADDEPVSLEWNYLPCHLFPGLEENDLSGSLWHLLADVYDTRFTTADQWMRVRGATAAEADALQIPAGEPVFSIERVSCSQHGQPIEYMRSVWRGDRYDFHVRLTAGS